MQRKLSIVGAPLLTWTLSLRNRLRRLGPPAPDTVLVMERDGTLQRASTRILISPSAATPQPCCSEC
jgi:hypothetical protein